MKKYIIGGAVIIVVLLLLSWGKLFGGKTIMFWNDTQVACLPNGHTNVALHIHQHLKIIIDGVAEAIPSNIGVTSGCMAEVHTHDASGQIHVEAMGAGKTFTLHDFFAVWKKPLERDGYTLMATVNGEPNADPSKFPLKDDMQIVLTYTSASSTDAQ